MKKTAIVLLALVVSVSFFGCAAAKQETAKNTLFTDSFFADVVEISDSSWGQISGDQMEPVVQYLKGLTLTETAEHLVSTDENGKQRYGLDLITFKKIDGTAITFLRNHTTMTCLYASSFVVEGKNLESGLKEAFTQAFNQNCK